MLIGIDATIFSPERHIYSSPLLLSAYACVDHYLRSSDSECILFVESRHASLRLAAKFPSANIEVYGTVTIPEIFVIPEVFSEYTAESAMWRFHGLSTRIGTTSMLPLAGALCEATRRRIEEFFLSDAILHVGSEALASLYAHHYPDLRARLVINSIANPLLCSNEQLNEKFDAAQVSSLDPLFHYSPLFGVFHESLCNGDAYFLAGLLDEFSPSSLVVIGEPSRAERALLAQETKRLGVGALLFETPSTMEELRSLLHSLTGLFIPAKLGNLIPIVEYINHYGGLPLVSENVLPSNFALGRGGVVSFGDIPRALPQLEEILFTQDVPTDLTTTSIDISLSNHDSSVEVLGDELNHAGADTCDTAECSYYVQERMEIVAPSNETAPLRLSGMDTRLIPAGFSRVQGNELVASAPSCLFIGSTHLNVPLVLSFSVRGEWSDSTEGDVVIAAVCQGVAQPPLKIPSGGSCKVRVPIPAMYTDYSFVLYVSHIDTGQSLHHPNTWELFFSDFSLELAGSQQPLERRGLHWASHLLDYSGYASLSRQITYRLLPSFEHADLEILPADPEFVTEALNRHDPIVQFSDRYAVRTVNEGINVLFYVPTNASGDSVISKMKKSRPEFERMVMFTMFETNRISADWVKAFEEVDEVWVPSQFTLKVFSQSGVPTSKLHVIPIGVDDVRFHPGRLPLFPRKSGEFRFLSVFQWNERKAWDVLLSSYVRTFRRSEDVVLILRSYPDRIKEPCINDRINSFLISLGVSRETAPRIELLPEAIPDEDMPGLYTSCDCFVLPSRGEAIGLPYQEAMACGLPVIATRWGGHLDFMTDENSYLLNTEGLVEVSHHHRLENPHYRKGMLWAAPSGTHLCKLLRDVFEDKEGARRRGELARETMEKSFTIEKTVECIRERVQFHLEEVDDEDERSDIVIPLHLPMPESTLLGTSD
jgi:Glycosyl transferases group 1